VTYNIDQLLAHERQLQKELYRVRAILDSIRQECNHNFIQVNDMLVCTHCKEEKRNET